jgi:hypothetical protein
MYRAIPFVLLAMLGACTVAPKTPMQAAYDVTSSYVVAVKAATAYTSLPRCSKTVLQGCSDQAKVDAVRAADNEAYTDVKNVQTVSRDVTASPTDEQKAVVAADAAIVALQRVIPQTTKE